ncbi:MAG: hypothetical protein M3N56_12665 [Actinomycetota bacterium]|nr:hypothetical protein [Actinomycetota bacterium]
MTAESSSPRQVIPDEVRSCNETSKAFASERAATRRDASNPAALAEYRDWEATLGDGIE